MTLCAPNCGKKRLGKSQQRICDTDVVCLTMSEVAEEKSGEKNSTELEEVLRASLEHFSEAFLNGTYIKGKR